MKIHQIYLDYDGFWPDIFQESKDSWSSIPNTEYKLWSEEDIEELVKKYPDMEELYHRVQYPIQRVDLARWIIIYDQGGLYADLDVVNKSGNVNFIKYDHFISKLKFKYEMDIFYFNEPQHYLLEKLFQYLISNYDEVTGKEIYKKWKGRYILQSCGAYALDRYWKRYKLNPHTIHFTKIRANNGKYNKTIKYVHNSPVIVYTISSWNNEHNNITNFKKSYFK